ncbi:MAG: hypothetical protein ABMB14_11170 [Myxococcota bacterium]
MRRLVSSIVFKPVEDRMREWIDGVRRDNAEAIDALRKEVATHDAAAPTGLDALVEENAQLKKKVSMAMGAIQAASAQIVQLRQELEQVKNLAHQAMQKATSAEATAEAATAGVSELEATRSAGTTSGAAPAATAKPASAATAAPATSGPKPKPKGKKG